MKVFLVLMAVLLVVVLVLSPHFSRSKVCGKVLEKTVKRHEDSDKYLISIMKIDGKLETLENTDSVVEWKFNSSDLYGKIKKGNHYCLDTYGWRFPVFSWYKNIVGVSK